MRCRAGKNHGVKRHSGWFISKLKTVSYNFILFKNVNVYYYIKKKKMAAKGCKYFN